MDQIKDGDLLELRDKYPPIVVEDTRIPTLNYDENEPRLIISEIINENFKSYGGIRTLGPFHKNFTCIIGPNGSGKSNVIDAMLFVFGFRASKIRSKKLSVLIHKSELFPNVPSCTVQVLFQRIIPTGPGDEDYEIVENSKFVVSRTAFKDNSSTYKINEKKVGTKEVADFLRKQGIDLDHNRFLILQGEVEQISLMKPKAITEHDEGLLEYLEDIIGSNRFKNPINILAKREEELCVLRMEKLNRVKLVEKEKKDLEGVRNEALRYLRLCNEITIRKNIAFQIKRKELRAMENLAKEKVDECVNEMKIILDNIERINSLKDAKEKAVKEIVQQHLIKMQEYEKSKKRFNNLEIEDAALRDSRKHCKAKADETKKMIKSKENELAKFENVPQESVSRIEQLRKEIQDLEKIKEKETINQQTAQSDLKEETKELQNKCDEKSSNLRKEEELLHKQESKIKEVKCERDLLLSNLTKEEERLARIEESLKTTNEHLNRDKELIARLKVDLPKAQKNYDDLIKELENSKKLAQETQIKMQEIQQLLDVSSSESGEQTVKFLLDQQSRGNLKNIIGRLGDLASVDPKYDVAFSTACGRLDNIVTETMDDAQRCVELMKRSNMGRSAFIGMEKVSCWEYTAKKPFKTPTNGHRAFDLLMIVDERYTAVFYFALRDLLIANDIDTASKINRESSIRFRIVTLKGELIETTGAMTGGGKSMSRGKISTNSDKVAAAAARRAQASSINRPQLQQELSDLRKRFTELQTKMGDISTNIDELSRMLEGYRRQKKDCDDRQKPLLAQEATLTQEMAIVNEKISTLRPNTAQVAELDKNLKVLGASYDKKAAIVDGMKKETTKLKDEIQKMGLAKLGGIKLRLDSVVDQIKEKSDTLKKINMSVKNAEKICARTKVALEELNGQKIKLDESIIEMDKTLKELDIRATENIKEYQQTNVDVEKLAEIKGRMELEMSALNDEYKNQDCSRKQSQRVMDDGKEKLSQLTWNLGQIQGTIDKLKLFSIPEECDENESFGDILGDCIDEGHGDTEVVMYSSQADSHSGQTLRVYTDEELDLFKVQKIGFQDLEDKVNKQRPNLTAIEEYRVKEEQYMQRAAELTTVTEIRDQQRRQGEQLRRQRLDEFLAGFALITGKLKEMYQLITLGGDAELELVDTLDPFSEGIVFSVRPPKKSWKNISNLSGGEKTLSSLALVFALHHFKPTPFYVMDEIDAALDFKNVSIVANYIKERTRNAQFIIISLRNNMYELADRLVGISKPYNFSKTCVLNPRSLERCLSVHRNAPATIDRGSQMMYQQQQPQMAVASEPQSQVALADDGSVPGQTDHGQTDHGQTRQHNEEAIVTVA